MLRDMESTPIYTHQTFTAAILSYVERYGIHTHIYTLNFYFRLLRPAILSRVERDGV